MNQRTEIDETRVIVMLKTVKQLKFWSQTKIQKIHAGITRATIKLLATTTGIILRTGIQAIIKAII